MEALFVKSSDRLAICPPPDMPEYAFIGRSNVGKSSLINYLLEKRDLAKTSSTPGKTQLINHFLVEEKWYLVDLPGYGYARTSKTAKAKWDIFIENYLLHRPNLLSAFVLIDSRHEALKIDLEFMEWLGSKGIPFSIVFTKLDKLGKTQGKQHIAAYKNKLLESWEELPPIFITSSEEKIGRTEILDYIYLHNPLFKKA